MEGEIAHLHCAAWSHFCVLCEYLISRVLLIIDGSYVQMLVAEHEKSRQQTIARMERKISTLRKRLARLYGATVPEQQQQQQQIEEEEEEQQIEEEDEGEEFVAVLIDCDPSSEAEETDANRGSLKDELPYHPSAVSSTDGPSTLNDHTKHLSGRIGISASESKEEGEAEEEEQGRDITDEDLLEKSLIELISRRNKKPRLEADVSRMENRDNMSASKAELEQQTHIQNASSEEASVNSPSKCIQVRPSDDEHHSSFDNGNETADGYTRRELHTQETEYKLRASTPSGVFPMRDIDEKTQSENGHLASFSGTVDIIITEGQEQEQEHINAIEQEALETTAIFETTAEQGYHNRSSMEIDHPVSHISSTLGSENGMSSPLTTRKNELRRRLADTVSLSTGDYELDSQEESQELLAFSQESTNVEGSLKSIIEIVASQESEDMWDDSGEASSPETRFSQSQQIPSPTTRLSSEFNDALEQQADHVNFSPARHISSQPKIQPLSQTIEQEVSDDQETSQSQHSIDFSDPQVVVEEIGGSGNITLSPELFSSQDDEKENQESSLALACNEDHTELSAEDLQIEPRNAEHIAEFENTDNNISINASIEFSDEASLFGEGTEENGVFSSLPPVRPLSRGGMSPRSHPVALHSNSKISEDDSQDLSRLMRSPQRSQHSYAAMHITSPEATGHSTLLSSVSSSYPDDMRLSHFDLPSQPIQAINSRNPITLHATLSTGNVPIIHIDFCVHEPKILVCTRSKVSIYELVHGNWKLVDYHITSTQREQFFKALFTPDGEAVAIAASVQRQDLNSDSMENCVRFYTINGRGVEHGEDLSKRPYLCHLSLGSQGKVHDMIFVEWNDALLTVSEDGSFLCAKMLPDWTGVTEHLNIHTRCDEGNESPAIEFLAITDLPSVVVGCTDDKMNIYDAETGAFKELHHDRSLRIMQRPVYVEKLPDGLLTYIIVHSPVEDSDQTSASPLKRECGRFVLGNDGIRLVQTYRGRGRPCDDVIAIAATRFYFAAGCMDGSVSIFNSRTGNCVAILVDMETESLTACRFHEDLPFFACGGANGTLCIYVQSANNDDM